MAPLGDDGSDTTAHSCSVVASAATSTVHYSVDTSGRQRADTGLVAVVSELRNADGTEDPRARDGHLRVQLFHLANRAHGRRLEPCSQNCTRPTLSIPILAAACLRIRVLAATLEA